MEKLVVKTAVKTVLIIVGILAVVFAIFNFAFPQYMATATENMGNYDLAIKYASLRYYYTKDCSDLARCFDDSVLAGDDKFIIQYGEELLEHKDFDEVCNDRNTQYGGGFDYKRRVNSKLAVSYYNSGEIEKGIVLAAEMNGTKSFSIGNPLMSLAARIKDNSDSEGAEFILAFLSKIEPEDDTEKGYLAEIKSAMNGVISAGNAGK